MSDERAQEEMDRYLVRCAAPHGEIRLLTSFINPEEGAAALSLEGANQLEFSEPPPVALRRGLKVTEYRPLRTGEAAPLF